MNLIRYNGPNSEHLFSLMIDVPEKRKHCTIPCDGPNNFGVCDCDFIDVDYNRALKKCEESAIGIDNYELLPIKSAYTPEWIYYTCDLLPTRIKVLKVNDTFPLPDNIEWEVMYQFYCFGWIDCNVTDYNAHLTVKHDVRKIVRLKLKSVPEKDTVIINFKDDLQYGVQRILRDQGAASREVFVAINDAVEELISKYTITRKP